MNRPTTQASSIVVSVLFFLGFAAFGRAQEPSAEEILRAARLTPMSKQASLRAQIRTEKEKTPFTITLDRGVVSYAFADPEQEIQLVLGEESSDLRERKGGKTAEVKPARFDEPVRGTPLSYEDLALRLLYWPRPKLLGDDIVRTRRAWKLEIQAPRGQSQYGVARLWIDQQSGAVLRIEGYGRDGRILKKFEMLSAQKINQQWMLKTMRVESFDPATHERTGRTYLEVLGKVKS